jgi:hypothetical protein
METWKLLTRASKRVPGRKLFVVDQLGQYVSDNTVPAPLKTLVQTCRHYGIDGVIIAQQANIFTTPSACGSPRWCASN